MKIYVVFNSDFTFYYVVTNNIDKIINSECFYEEVKIEDFIHDIEFLKGA